MVMDKIVVVAVAVLLWVAILLGGSMLLGSCDDQSGGYPTPQLRSDAR